MNSQFTLDNFNCFIAQADEVITLIAEHQKSSQIFTRVLTKDDLKTITRDSFFTISTVYQCIQEFFKMKSSTASLSLTPNGKLSYTCKRRSYGNMIKQLKFIILLEKREMNREMLSTKKINQKEEKFEFNPDTVFGLYFLFSNKNKTIADNCSVVAKHVPTKQPLPKSKTSKISFCVEKNEQRGLGLGIAPLEALNKEQPFLNSKAYMYYNGSYVWKCGKGAELNGICPSKGDIVTFFVDPEAGNLRVEVNGAEVDNHRFDAEDMKARDFYPFVYKTGSIRVTLL